MRNNAFAISITTIPPSWRKTSSVFVTENSGKVVVVDYMSKITVLALRDVRSQTFTAYLLMDG